MSITTRKITASAITAAIIFVVTFTVRLPVPATSGAYINLGDVIIYISAYVLGWPMAAMAAAVGSALADTAAGAAVYIPATFVIKGLMGLICALLSADRRPSRFALSCIIGGAVMTFGYAAYELILFGPAYAVSSLPFNLIQWAGGTVVAIVLFPIAKRLTKAIRLN